MLYALEGIIELVCDDFIVLNSGNGWSIQIWVPRPELFSPEASVRLLTLLKVREDRLMVYGFSHANERQCFEWLTEIPGIGAKTALQVLRNLSPDELAETVSLEQVDRLVAVPGIGPSSAKKMIPYLSDKFKKWAGSMDAIIQEMKPSPIFEETRQWLIELGLSANEAEKEIRAYQKEYGALTSCKETIAVILQKRER